MNEIERKQAEVLVPQIWRSNLILLEEMLDILSSSLSWTTKFGKAHNLKRLALNSVDENYALQLGYNDEEKQL